MEKMNFRQKRMMNDELMLPAEIYTDSAEETEEVGKTYAQFLSTKGVPTFTAMYGDLGVGKTAFVRGFASFFGIGRVKSPTFSIVNEYMGDGVPIFHFDMYRINDEDDLYSIGFYEYFSRGGHILSEWCEKIPYAIPEDAYTVRIEKTAQGGNRRRICIKGGTGR